MLDHCSVHAQKLETVASKSFLQRRGCDIFGFEEVASSISDHPPLSGHVEHEMVVSPIPRLEMVKDNLWNNVGDPYEEY
jgi:hypothetical protein